MSVRKEKIKTVIISKDSDFKRRSLNLLIEVAYPAEKYSVSKCQEGKEIIESDETIRVLIINGSDYDEDKLEAMITDLTPLVRERPLKTIVYLSNIFAKITEDKEKVKGFNFFEHPVKKCDFNHVLNPIKELKKKIKESEKKGAVNSGFLEASLHVKDTVEELNKVIADRKNLDGIRNVGQRFNGIFGAFSFVENKEGYRELAKLSSIIDDLCRHYREGEKHTEISQEHFDLLLGAAKCSYSMLKSLRNNQRLTEAQHEVFNKIVETYDKYPEIERRDSQTQAEVDKIIDSQAS